MALLCVLWFPPRNMAAVSVFPSCGKCFWDSDQDKVLIYDESMDALSLPVVWDISMIAGHTAARGIEICTSKIWSWISLHRSTGLRCLLPNRWETHAYLFSSWTIQFHEQFQNMYRLELCVCDPEADPEGGIRPKPVWCRKADSDPQHPASRDWSIPLSAGLRGILTHTHGPLIQ